MASRDGKVLAVLLVGSAILAVSGLAYVLSQVIDFLYAERTGSHPTIPDNLRAIRILEDRLGLSKTTFLSYRSSCNTLTNIAVGDFHENPGNEVVLADCQQAQVVDMTGKTLRTVRWAKAMRFPKIHRIGTGSDDWIAVDDEGLWEDVKAASAYGNILWSRGSTGTYHGVAIGNLDHDPLPEFVIWENEAPGLEILDHDGSVLRVVNTADPVKAVVILEGSDPKETRICYSIMDRELVFLDVDGNVIARRKPNAPALHYMIPVEWPELSSRKMFVQTNWHTLYFLTFDGENLATFISPSLKNQLYWMPARRAIVQFPERSGSYLVLLLRLHYHPRSVLHIYEPSGALVYHEILENEYGGLGVVLDERGRATSILVGGKAGVLSYSLARGTPIPAAEGKPRDEGSKARRDNE